MVPHSHRTLLLCLVFVGLLFIPSKLCGQGMSGASISRSGRPSSIVLLQLIGHPVVQGIYLNAWVALAQGLQGKEAVILMLVKDIDQSGYI